MKYGPNNIGWRVLEFFNKTDIRGMKGILSDTNKEYQTGSTL